MSRSIAQEDAECVRDQLTQGRVPYPDHISVERAMERIACQCSGKYDDKRLSEYLATVIKNERRFCVNDVARALTQGTAFTLWESGLRTTKVYVTGFQS